MNTLTCKAFPRSVLATALLAAFGAAQSDEVSELSKPESTVSVGVGYISDDKERFGQYTGMRDERAYGLLDLDVVKRDDSTGTWILLDGRNLGLENRELRFEHRRQGDWGYFIDFSQTPRYSQYTVNTGLSGIGTPNQIVNGEALRDVELKTERTATTVGFDKVLPAAFDVQVRFRNEEKTGSRLFGRTGFDFLAEPIDSSTQQVEATLGYAGERLQLSGGYYGGWYNNHNNALYATGGSGAAYSPIGLPPDNESHQLHLAGGYGITPTTRGTFKLAYARAKQNDNFIVPALPGNTALDGRIDTTLAQLGIHSRPIPKLSLLANVRYEDRDDRTPVLLYSSLAGATSTFSGFYEPRSLKTTAGKVEAGYQLPAGFRAVGSVDHEIKERNIPYWCGVSGCGALASVSTRAETGETNYRVQLRRALSETINGALSYARSNRGGTGYLTTVLNNGTTGMNLVAPLHLVDRERDLWRLMADWTPIENLAFQFTAENARDDYSGRTYGLRNGDMQNYSVDAAYAFSEAWKATAWVSHNDTQAQQTACEQATVATGCPNTAADPIWSANLRSIGNAAGVGLRSKPATWLEIGADLQHTRDHAEYRTTPMPIGVVPAVTPPPDSQYRQTRLKLFARYEINKNTGARVDYAYERWEIDDWTWTNWTYSDGTRVLQDPVQKVHFFGISGYYRWW